MTRTQTPARPDERPAGRRPGTPGRFSRWMQHRVNARMDGKVRNGKGTFTR